MLAFPNCKINIGLNITSKRADGYHNIETIFYPVKWCDVLEINERSKLSNANYSYNNGIAINTSGIQISGDIKSNLCYKAYQLLKSDFQLPDVVLHLHKIIPMGAGLGGGSSDATFTLINLNCIFKLNISDEELKKYALKLGSDCAFFLNNNACFAGGRGDELEKTSLNLTGYYITIIKPEIHISTALAYSMVKPSYPAVSLKELINQPIESWKTNIKNDFEVGMFSLYPEIEKIKNQLYNYGCVYASMSGSGSAIYGISTEKLYFNNTFINCKVWQGEL